MLLLTAPMILPAYAQGPAGGEPGLVSKAVHCYEAVFSTYFGGSGGDLLRDITVDGKGNVYVAGIAGSADFPRSPGEIPGSSKEGGGMVAKFSLDGRLVWCRVIGAAQDSYLYSVKVDKAGDVIVAGRMPVGMPTTPGAFQPTTLHPCGFAGKLKGDGSGWVWASYVGTGQFTRDMTIDDKGDVYCLLDWFKSSKETMPAAWFANAYSKTPHGGTGDHFGPCDAGVIKISNDGRVLWATWIGGTNGNDWASSLGVGADHCPVMLLRTYSTDMPVTAGGAKAGPPDAADQGQGWIGKLSADGSRLLFGTYIADAQPRTHNVALDAKDNIFICTCTRKWPVTPGAFQTKFGGGPEDYGVAKYSPEGKLLAATYIGGNGDETNGPDEIAIDAHGNVMIAGSSSSTDYPVTPGAIQSKNAGAGGPFPFDGVISVLSNDLTKLLYSTYIGGSGDEMARACRFGLDGTLYVGGVTTSKDFPVKNAWQAKYGGDPGFGSKPVGGKYPVGWGNGDTWILKLRPVASAAAQ